jgi:hypothetical protein
LFDDSDLFLEFNISNNKELFRARARDRRIEALKQHKEQNLGSELRLDTGTKPSKLQDKAAKVKAMLAARRRGEVTKLDPKEQRDRARAHSMAQCYGAQLAELRGDENDRSNYARKVLKAGEKGYADFLRASDLADALKVDYETFIRAQFYWFQAWFNGKRPLPYQLSTKGGDYSAAQRVTLYQDAIAQGKINPTRAILGPDMRPAKATRKQHHELSSRALQSLMEGWDSTEEEVLRVFARDECAADFFDLEWLSQNKTYRRLKQQGEL